MQTVILGFWFFSKQGLLSHLFTEPGVFYYSDQNFQEAAEYIGTVIVKPKPKEHRVMITENGFDPGTTMYLQENLSR